MSTFTSIKSSHLFLLQAVQVVLSVGRLIVGMFGAGVFLIGLSYVDCTQTALAVVLLVLAVALSGLVYSGYFVNHMDIAPQYAGTLMGLSNGISALSGFAPPYVAFAVTQSVSNLDHFLFP